MTISVLTQAELAERVGGEEALALLASQSAVLDADAEAAIAAAIADKSSEIEAALQGLSIDYTTIPEELKGIGATLVREQLYEMVWSLVPDKVAEAAERARKKLEKFAAGLGSATSATPAQQEAAKFTSSNVGDDRGTNSRQATTWKMRRLP
jgi:hypothetical protein